MGDIDSVAGAAQRGGQLVGQGCFVFDHQQAHRYRTRAAAISGASAFSRAALRAS